MNKAWLGVLLWACGMPILAAEESAAMRLGKLLAHPTCSIAGYPEDEWRDAGAGDYLGAHWDGWRAATGAKTPWRAEGDFDGDGMLDVAKVIIRKADGIWMMGVEFGRVAQEKCRKVQISSNMARSLPSEQAPIQGVMTLAKGKAFVRCHLVPGRGPANCLEPDSQAFVNRDRDVFLSFDALPSFITAYLWHRARWDQAQQRYISATENEPDARMVFDGFQVVRELLPAVH